MIRGPHLAALALLCLLAGLGLASPAGLGVVTGVLGIVGLVWGVRRPHLLLYALAFATAAIPHGLAAKRALAVSVGGVPFHLIDLLFLACMAAWAFAALIALHRDRGEFTATWRRHRTLLWPFLALMIVVGLSAGVGLFHRNDLWDVVRDLRSAAYYLVLPVAIWTLDSRERVRGVIVSLLAGAALFSLLCIYTALASDDFFFKEIVLTYWRGQARIYFHNHYLLAFAIPFVTYRLLLARDLWTRLGAVSLIGLFFTALALSLTRNLMAATVGALLLTPFLLMLRTERTRLLASRRVAATLLLLALAGGGAGLGWKQITGKKGTAIPSLGQRFETLERPAVQDASFRGRIVSYRYGLEDALEYPVLGKGFGMLFRIPWGKSGMRPVRVEGYQPVVDMTPLTVLGKSGALGLAVLLWFGAALFYLQWRGLRRRRIAASTQVLSAVLLASTLGLFVSSMLHTVLLTSLTTLSFAMLCAITSHLADLDPATAPAAPTGP